MGGRPAKRGGGAAPKRSGDREVVRDTAGRPAGLGAGGAKRPPARPATARGGTEGGGPGGGIVRVKKRGKAAAVREASQADQALADSRDRFAARARAERRAAGWRIARRVALAAALAGVAGVVLFSPVFAVREGQIEVRGIAGVVTPEQVGEVVAPAVGVPLARLNVGQLAGQVEEIRGVKSASVARVWPTGMTVTIEPRIPVAAVARQGDFVLLDNEGVQLAAVLEPPSGVPVIDVPLTDRDARTLQTVLGVLATIPADLAAKITSIGAATRDTVEFTLAGGQQVLWGDASQSALKAAALKVLLRTPAAEYNVSAPNMPFLRVADGGGDGEGDGDGEGEGESGVEGDGESGGEGEGEFWDEGEGDGESWSDGAGSGEGEVAGEAGTGIGGENAAQTEVDPLE
ncbi:MAG: cell division protein FtsQ/DivIB [Bifidobacteriaceae bacterium]|nr:cell division protein FtsQ/DivIB [Bifidobacteriaceae bacterium]